MKLSTISLAASLIFSTVSAAHADRYYHSSPQYKVTITNITKGQSFTPILAATHSSKVSLFSLGEPASAELGQIAEGGNIAPLNEQLSNSNSVGTTTASEGLLMPGQSVELMLDASYRYRKLSFAAMLLPTNDTIVAINGVNLPSRGTKSVFASAYDAGTETNDEMCSSIPGPTCGGVPFSPEDEGEGYVYISSGIHGIGDLESSQYDWRGKVAKVVIEKMW